MGFHDNNLSDCPWSLSVHSWIRTSSIWIFSWYLLYNMFIVFNSIYRFHLYTLQKQYYIIIMLCIYMYIHVYIPRMYSTLICHVDHLLTVYEPVQSISHLMDISVEYIQNQDTVSQQLNY